MAAPDFPSSPTNGQQYTAPSGLVYTYDGAVWLTQANPQASYWSDTGTALTPTTATRQVSVPGTGTVTPTVQLGSLTAKARLQAATGVAGMGIFENRDWATNAYDDATKPGWGFQLRSDTDQILFQRSPAGSTTVGILATLDGPSGRMDIPGAAAGVDYSQLTMGTAVARGRIHMESGGRLDLLMNGKLGSAWASDDTTKPSWLLGLGADSTGIWRAPATTGAPAWVNFFNLDNGGNLTLNNFAIPRARGGWAWLTNNQSIPAGGAITTLTFSPIVDTAGYFNTTYWQIIPDATSLVLVVLNVMSTGSNFSIYIQQWQNSAWNTRAQASAPVAAQLGSGVQVAMIIDTRFGQQMQLAMANNSSSAIAVQAPAGNVGYYVLGRTP